MTLDTRLLAIRYPPTACKAGLLFFYNETQKID